MRALLAITVLVLIGALFLLFRSPEEEVPPGERIELESSRTDKLAAKEIVFESSGEALPNRKAEVIVEDSNPQGIRLVGFQPIRSNASQEPHNHVIAEWRGRLEPSIDGSLLSRIGGGPISMTLPDGSSLAWEVERHLAHTDLRGSYLGKVVGSDLSRVLFSYSRDAVFGSINLGSAGELWEFRNAGDGEQVLALIDASEMGTCGVCEKGGGE